MTFSHSTNLNFNSVFSVANSTSLPSCTLTTFIRRSTYSYYLFCH
ncbi:hypothetical protein E2C01_090811 [Portunus trituberculatus]|uniref:Uncharacterized protein n=1 Tax=Portunus trituberculatus TaxID=210409 RepID=A0A5B7JMD4_PORTR|nr:hypothetical protein [Portunus trituberculatus]